MRRLGVLFGLVPLSTAAVGCGADAGPPPALLVGDIAYAESELGVLSTTQRERLAELTAFGAAAARGELARLGEPFIERERQALVLQRLAAEVSVREAGLDEAELRAAYAQAPEYELVVRHLVVLAERWRSDEERAAARRKAQAALERIRAGEPFAKVAGEVSEEPGAAERGGLLEPGRAGTWVSEFWEAASALDVGEVSGVVETEYGYHVLRLDERRPIPFDEVRNEVLGRLVDLPAAAGRAESWAASRAASVRVDAEAVGAWRAGAGASSDAALLATWPGGSLTGGELRRYLRTLNPDATARLRAATDAAYLGVVSGVARNEFLASVAEEMGIRLSVDEAAAAERRWVDRARAWATVLGFAEGMTSRQIKDAALNALGSSRQNVAIVREEIAAMPNALRARYPVVVPDSTAEAESAADGGAPVSSSADAVKSATSG